MEYSMIKIRDTFTELSEIFKYLDKDILKKIPQRLIDEINKNKNTEYQFVFEEDKSIEQQSIAEETKDLLSALYIMYCCDEDNKEEILRTCKENEEKYYKHQAEKYSYENLFKNKEKSTTKENVIDEQECMGMVEYKEQKWFQRILLKIKKIFIK